MPKKIRNPLEKVTPEVTPPLNTDMSDCYYKGASTNENRGYSTHGNFKHDRRNKERQPEVPGSLMNYEDVQPQSLASDKKKHFKRNTDSNFDKDLGNKGMNAQNNA